MNFAECDLGSDAIEVGLFARLMTHLAIGDVIAPRCVGSAQSNKLSESLLRLVKRDRHRVLKLLRVEQSRPCMANKFRKVRLET